MQSWRHVCDILQGQSNPLEARAASSIILLQASLDECISENASKPSPMLEASLHFAEALSSDINPNTSPWLHLLNVQARLELTNLHIKLGNAGCAEHLLRSVPQIAVASIELNLWQNLCMGMTRARLQRLCGERSLSCARLTCTLNEVAKNISNLELNQDLPARLMLETYLSCTVNLCKWLAESGTVNQTDLIAQYLKPVSEAVYYI